MSISPQDAAAPIQDTVPAVQWEEASCLLCGSPRWVPFLEAPDVAPGSSGLWFAVVQCLECGLCFTNPRPSPATIAPFYPDVYRPHRPPCSPRRRTRRPWFRRLKERHTLPWPREGRSRLLDFGCGGGSYLERMHRQGWQVTGVDVSARAVESIRTELGLHALVGSLPHPEVEPASFDVVTMWHSLEHVHEPLEVLRATPRLLAPGGRLLVAVPNLDSLPFRWFGSAWYGLDLPRHLTHFTPRTLEMMLRSAGFRAGPIRMVRHSHWLRASAGQACRAASAPRAYRWLTGKPLSRLVTWYAALTRQSDCILVTAERL